MTILLLFAFLGGIVTILSPCILPVLPIVLSGSLTGGKRRPVGIVTGFILSFTFFTLFLTTLVKLLGLSADTLRGIAVVAVFLFGLSLLVPQFQMLLEQLFSLAKLDLASPDKLSSRSQTNNDQNTGFISGVLVGVSLGLVWTPCVGPIMAAMITLAATSTVSFGAVLITFTYATGTAIPLLLITYGGRQLLSRVPFLFTNTVYIQKIFGVLMILTALAIYFNVDRTFQNYILQKFPQYGTGLTQLEDNQTVKDQLARLKDQKPMLNLENIGTAPDFTGGGTWINSKPLTLEKLRGKVVLVDFWTYTCINCIRTLPYVEKWYEKYKDKGLVVIGVHTPEFEFEKNTSNVEKAVKNFGLTYPIVQDNGYKIWTAYNNRYWPAKYLIDKDGKIRYTHFGEGEYDKTEEMIQTLLKETGTSVTNAVNNPQYETFAQTPETYLGYNRLGNGLGELASSPFPKRGIQTRYDLISADLPKNSFGYSGDWIINDEYAHPFQKAFLELNFTAKDVYLVMRPLQTGNSHVKVSLLPVDGFTAVPTNFTGKDVHEGIVTVDTDRLYHLISLDKPGNYILELEFLDDYIEIYAFTFG